MSGETINCACGQPIAIPMMRELKTFPHSEDEAQDRPLWTWRHAVVTLGFLIAIGGLSFAGVFWYTNMITDQDRSTRWIGNVDRATPAQTWEIWKYRLQDGIHGPRPDRIGARADFQRSIDQIFNAQRLTEKQRLWLYVGLGIAAFGGLIALAAFFFPAATLVGENGPRPRPIPGSGSPRRPVAAKTARRK